MNKPGNIVPKRSLVVLLQAEVSVMTPATGSMSDVNDRQRYKNEPQFVKNIFFLKTLIIFISWLSPAKAEKSF